MKQSEYKEIKEGNVVSYLIAVVKQNFQMDTAYKWAILGNLLSPTVYSIISVLFLKVIYQNINSIAGYAQNEMLFLRLISQIAFLTGYHISYVNIEQFISDVRSGDFDLTLTKPISPYLVSSLKRISIFTMIRDILPAVVIMFFIIQWNLLNISPLSLIMGIGVFVIGTAISHIFIFLSALPVIWIGESSSLTDLATSLRFGGLDQVPYEGYNKNFRLVFTYILPYLIVCCLSTSVMLNKADPITTFIYCMLTFVILAIIQIVIWRKALKAYTSASS